MLSIITLKWMLPGAITVFHSWWFCLQASWSSRPALYDRVSHSDMLFFTCFTEIIFNAVNNVVGHKSSVKFNNYMLWYCWKFVSIFNCCIFLLPLCYEQNHVWIWMTHHHLFVCGQKTSYIAIHIMWYEWWQLVTHVEFDNAAARVSTWTRLHWER